MIGEARALAVDVELPEGVTLRRVTEEADVRAMSAMQDEVFGDPVSDDMADALLRRLPSDDGMQLWVAEAQGQIVSAGRLDPVAVPTSPGSGAARPAGMARPRDLPRIDVRAGPVGARYGQDADQQRLDGVLAPDPRTFRLRQSVDDDAVRLATLNAARSCGANFQCRQGFLPAAATAL